MAIAAAVGVGTTLYGANAQKKAQAGANAQNAANTKTENLSAWQSYLISRGVDPSSVTEAGQLPQAGAKAINTRMPLWATYSQPTGNAPVSVTRRPGAAPIPTPGNTNPMAPLVRRRAV